MTTTILFPEINEQIANITAQHIPDDRKQILQSLIDFIQEQKNEQQKIHLNFICTHNSRRSHLSQVWAQTAALFYNISDVSCYSGGTEATALFPVVAKTLENTGFKVEKLTATNNPIYSIKATINEHPIIGFSKKFDHTFNPESNFAAIMTCSQADQGCPFIAGASKRIPITYEDPKAFDDSPLQIEKYNERSLQIASEMFYVFSKIK